MKKVLKLSVFILLLIFSVNVYAGEATPESININAEVLQNGDMIVTETIKYDTVGAINGVYRDILLSSKDKYGASSIQVNSVVVNGKQFTSSLETLNIGASEQYNLNDINDGTQIKVFYPTSRDFMMEIQYLLKDIILVHNDVAELHWDFIGDGWNNSIEKINITINMPEGSENLRAWGHGPLNGIVEIVDDKTVKLSVDNINPNTEVTARVVMEKEIFYSVKKTYLESALEDILNEEKKYANLANVKRELYNNIGYIYILNIILIVICPILWYNKKKKEFEKTDFKGKYYRELPEDYGPGIMGYILGVQGDPRIVTATLMDLARRGHITIKEIDGGNDFSISFSNSREEFSENTEIKDYEKYLINEMILDDSEEITIKEIKRIGNSGVKAKSQFRKQQKWIEMIQKEAEKVGVFKKEKRSAFKGCVFFALLPLIASAITTFIGIPYSDFMGAGLCLIIIYLLAILVTAVSIAEKMKYTKKGFTHKKQWKAFGKFLEDFSLMQDYPVQSLIVWEHYLVYAIALGKASKVIKQLEIMYPTELSNQNMDLYNSYAIMSLCRNSSSFNAIYSGFNSAITSTYSSPSGSGGGFSGGGGSGGGGGGGGSF